MTTIIKTLENAARDPWDFSDLDEPVLITRESKPDETIKQACLRCGGSGRVTFGYRNVQTGQCFQCRGTGTVTITQVKRREAARKGARTRETNLVAKRLAWKAAHPAEAAWIDACCRRERPFDFALAMSEALANYGSLTEGEDGNGGQLAAVRKCMARDVERAAQRKAEGDARATGLGEGAGKIMEALQTASGNGLKRPKLRTGEITFSLAPAHGKNGGCAYVKAGEQYLGKIEPNGTFRPVRECSDAMKAVVVEVARDPLAAAKLHGQQTGSCSCCGRELTDPNSIALGIGPICAGKFGW